jgi:hypothetical protein
MGTRSRNCIQIEMYFLEIFHLLFSKIKYNLLFITSRLEVHSLHIEVLL